MAQEEIRKGPWTEQEDIQLVFYVNLFGDHRWDFIAKVSGLQRWRETITRTGKSCRLRWVNYLQPGLKRGKMSPHEERLVLELHSKWGNRWSRIAQKLPGRTDNEIKNYWRTHMRKKAHEREEANISTSLSSSSTSNASSSSIFSKGNNPTVESAPMVNTKDRNFYDTGGFSAPVKMTTDRKKEDLGSKVYTLDEIWKDIELDEDNNYVKPISDGFSEGDSYFSSQTMASRPPLWNALLWTTVEDEIMMFPANSTTSITDQFYSFNNQEKQSIF